MQSDLQDSVSVANLNNAVSLKTGTVDLLTFKNATRAIVQAWSR